MLGVNMCVVIAKHLPEYGWVIAKNRDRNYKPVVSIKQSNRNGVQRLYMHDDKTRYTEGVNEYGVAILSASIMVKKDEKEGNAAAGSDDQSERTYYAPDGYRIRTALFKKTAKSALNTLISMQIPGNTLIADDNDCYILEGAFRDYHGPNKKYEYRFKKLRKTDTVVRTNHGIDLPWAGYQENKDNPHEKASRKSSINRLRIVQKQMDSINNPEDMLQVLSSRPEKDPQMNPIRLDDRRRSMKTTGQLLVIPKERTLHYRPTYSEISLKNYNNINSTKNKTFFEVISSRKLFDI
tara:strand:- start:340 stop:1221 length:882 start_codon:yes stop_codon:yes gene_type:complete